MNVRPLRAILSSLLLTLTLSAFPSISFGHDAIKCYIHGRVYISPIATETEVQLDELCPGITVQHFERHLVLQSDRFRVEIELIGKDEKLQGWMPIAYHWGRSVAHVGIRDVPVKWEATKPIVNE